MSEKIPEVRVRNLYATILGVIFYVSITAGMVLGVLGADPEASQLIIRGSNRLIDLGTTAAVVWLGVHALEYRANLRAYASVDKD